MFSSAIPATDSINDVGERNDDPPTITLASAVQCKQEEKHQHREEEVDVQKRELRVVFKSCSDSSRKRHFSASMIHGPNFAIVLDSTFAVLLSEWEIPPTTKTTNTRLPVAVVRVTFGVFAVGYNVGGRTFSTSSEARSNRYG